LLAKKHLLYQDGVKIPWHPHVFWVKSPQVAARFLVVVDEDDRIETLYTKAGDRRFTMNS
jgi:hypothetical protein